MSSYPLPYDHGLDEHETTSPILSPLHSMHPPMVSAPADGGLPAVLYNIAPGFGTEVFNLAEDLAAGQDVFHFGNLWSPFTSDGMSWPC